MSRSTPRNVLVITYWDREDPLVVNYTLPYLHIMQRFLPKGSCIHLVTLHKSGTRLRGEVDSEGIVHHSFPYKAFGFSGMTMISGLIWSLCQLVRRCRVDTLHAWCTPAGMVGYFVAMFTGRPLVIDSFEPHAEAMVENGTWKRGGLAFRTLYLFERLQTHKAQAVIALTEGMRDYARSKYGHVPDTFMVKPACVDLGRFSLRNVKRAELLRSTGLEGKLVAVYAGKFGGIYLDQEVFDLFRVARDHWGERFHVLLLTSHRTEELHPFMRRAGLDPEMFTIRWIQPLEVPDWMGLADWALTPVKPVPTKRYCSPVKDGEYWALGLPVMITPGISDDSEIIERYGVGCVIGTLDQAGYKRAVEQMDALLQQQGRMELYARIRPLAERYRNFSMAEHAYRVVYGV